MNTRPLNILEFPSNLGLKLLRNEAEPGVNKLPGWLRTRGFHGELNPENVLHLEPPAYSGDIEEASGIRNTDLIADYAKRQSQLLLDRFDEHAFQVILGGDCSILIGNALALKKRGKYGIFYLDGHTDFMVPEQSGTKAAAGMVLALITGHGPAKLANLQNLGPLIEEKHVYCVGNREYDADYIRPILETDVRYRDLIQLRSEGLRHTSESFLQMVGGEQLDGFMVHMDVDVLNNQIMPAVDSPQEDGLSYEELSEILLPLLSSEKAIGIQITILDPDLDKNGQYTDLFIRHLTAIIKFALNHKRDNLP